MAVRTSLTLQVFAVAALLGGLFLIIHTSTPLATPSQTASSTSQVSASAAATATSSLAAATATSSVATSSPKTATVKKPNAKPVATTTAPVAPETKQIGRIENPYPMPPLAFETVNDLARAALVNIFCTTTGGGSLRPISGSGVIIDSRGIVLTNAHVAQYILLSRSHKVNLTCFVRSGAPAQIRYLADVMYMPPQWVLEHAGDIKKEQPLGTGAHDYALLYIAEGVDGQALPSRFPALAVDTREAIGFLGDQILAASYPAEFQSVSASFSLYPASSISTIRQLFTLAESSVDVVSIGGVIEAQSGSSGGAIVNAWGRLIAMIATTSQGATTAERDLRGITLSYINRDIEAQSGYSLFELLATDPEAQTSEFLAKIAPSLIEQFMTIINK